MIALPAMDLRPDDYFVGLGKIRRIYVGSISLYVEFQGRQFAILNRGESDYVSVDRPYASDSRPDEGSHHE